MKRIIVIAAGILLFIFAAVINKIKDDGTGEIKQVLERADNAKTIAELNSITVELDSLMVKYPHHKAAVDSVIGIRLPQWTEKAFKKEKDELLRQAFYVAQDHIRGKMVNPNSAKFPSIINEASNCWEEKGVIIAQFWGEGTNAFNAVIRNKYQVKLKPENGKFRIIEAITY